MLNEINSKITGVMSGEDAELRQEALGIMRELLKDNKRVYIELVPNWDNPYDSDAIAAFVELPELGRVQIGFVTNGKTTCDVCGHITPKYPKGENGNPPKCRQCGIEGEEFLKRCGTASLLSQELRADPETKFYAECLEITGGDYGRSFGCNIKIRRK